MIDSRIKQLHLEVCNIQLFHNKYSICVRFSHKSQQKNVNKALRYLGNMNIIVNIVNIIVLCHQMLPVTSLFHAVNE